MDIFELDIMTQLESEHREFDQLLRYAKSCPVSQRKYILGQLKRSLIPHARAEERTLYAALLHSDLKTPADQKLELDEFYTEHSEMDSLLKELERMDAQDQRWSELIEKTRNKLMQHIKEEEGVLMREANRILDQSQRDALLQEYRALKESYVTDLPSQREVNTRRPETGARAVTA